MKAPSNNPTPVVLAIDVGGTNTSIALVHSDGGPFLVLSSKRYATSEQTSIIEPIDDFLARIETDRLPSPAVMAVSAAGPVTGRTINLTNAPWGVDGILLEKRYGIPTLVMNDFSAIAWGVLLLDPADTKELVPLPHADGHMVLPDPEGPIVVAGAGTGLGFGYILKNSGEPRVYPSEGGHVCLPVYDDETRDFSRWLEGRFGFAAGAEAGVSGQGISNLFRFMMERDLPLADSVRTIAAGPENAWPAAIAGAAASGDAFCSHVLDVFVRLYARVAADAASIFLPAGGVYLAGGIAAKNLPFFVRDNQFMATFGRAYRSHIAEIAARTPVFVVMDYAISLYGAANAAVHMHGASYGS